MCLCGQREKDQKLEELNHLRNHEIACTKLKHQLDLELKRDKVSDSCRRSAAEFKRSRSSWVFLVGSAEHRASIWMQTHMFDFIMLLQIISDACSRSCPGHTKKRLVKLL
jgi:hypothetical protein